VSERNEVEMLEVSADEWLTSKDDDNYLVSKRRVDLKCCGAI
jgi:hypothetical protein